MVNTFKFRICLNLHGFPILKPSVKAALLQLTNPSQDLCV